MGMSPRRLHWSVRTMLNGRLQCFRVAKTKTMSLLFGGISPNNHEKLLYSDAGVYGKTNSVDDNCVVWAPSTFNVYLLNKTRNSKIEAGPYNAVQYSKFVIQSPGILGPN